MRHLYACICLLFILQSCGRPLQVARLEPDPDASPTSYETRYRYGAKLLEQTVGTTTVETNFYDATPDYLVFDVNVINRGDRSILFDPTSAMLITDTEGVVPVIDPEMHLLGMDVNHMRRLKNQRTMNYVTTGLLVAGAIYGITADIGGAAETAGDALTVVDIGTNLAIDLVDIMVFSVMTEQDRLFRPYMVADAAVPPVESRYFWLDHTLRTTTIPPGESAYGKLVFLRTDEAGSVILKFYVADTEFSFPYVQRIYKP